MKIPEPYQADAQAMPEVLRKLLEAELAAGNELVEVFHCFPAPPAGACFRLAKPVTTRPRASDDGIDFYDRNTSSYSGEFTDARRFYFIIEPPHPPPPEPDMDAIRAGLTGLAKPAGPATASIETAPAKRRGSRQKHPTTAKLDNLRPDPLPPSKPPSVLERFRSSLIIDYEKWHEGIGYDLSLLKAATPEELVAIEELLIERGIHDWRDVEALASLDSPRARLLLRQALNSRNREIATAVISYAPGLLTREERTRTLVATLESSNLNEALTRTLLEIQEFHPPEVIEALWRGVLRHDGETAVHLAAMLMFLHERAKSAFDWDLRPFFLKFNTEDRTEREALYQELRARAGPAPHLGSRG